MASIVRKYILLREMITPAPNVKCGARELPVLSMTMHDGLMLQSDRFKKKIASVDLSGYKIVARNQLVVSFPIDEGVLSIQDVVDEGIVSPAYAIWDVNQSIVIPKFLELFLRCPMSISFYKSKLRGSTARRRTLPKETFLSMKMRAYSLPEQKRIAAILDKICEMKRNAEARLQKLDLLVKARFVEMFGDAIGSFFPRVALGDLCVVKSGGTPDRSMPEYWNNGTIPWVKTTELQNQKINRTSECITEKGLQESSAKLVPAGTILLAMYGQGKTRGMTAMLDIAAATNQACACIIPSEKVDNDYLWRYLILSYDKIRSQAQGAGQPNLNGQMVRSFLVPLPPLALQRQFAAFVEKVEGLKATAKKELEQVDLLYRAKLQEFFG